MSDDDEPHASGAAAETPAETPEGQTPGATPDDATPETPADDSTRDEGSASDESHAARGESEADDESASSEGSASDEGQSSEPEVSETSSTVDTATSLPAPVPKTTLTVTIDGVACEAKPGQKVIDAAEDAGTYVPRFCYHRRLTPVGMCRQCLVEIEGPRGPMMVVSCMTDVADGQVVRTDTPEIKKAQEGVIEFLLANHPLDCPVCDKGGECPLQDQAMSNGPGESRYLEEKRHFEKPIPISDLVLLDRERCILCDRCTRFADEVAGDKLIHFTHRGNNTQVQTFPDEPFASYFSGNTVQICPVGALTATPYRFRARPWDLEESESTCTSCAVGCRTVIQSSRDRIVRTLGVDSDAVNWSWLCDRGRFSFQGVDADNRLSEPLVRDGDQLVPTTWANALNVAAELLDSALDAGGGESIAVLGGARGTNEDAYVWAMLADALGVPHRDAQFGDGLPPELLDLPRATINEAANAATIVVVGPDLKEELPVLYLRLRDAAFRRRSRIIEICPRTTGLTSYAWKTIRAEPGAVDTITRALAADDIREQLAGGDVVVVAGRANLAESEAVAATAINAVLAACPGAKVLPALRRGNVVGAIRAGITPGKDGLDGLGILAAAAEGRLECLVLLGADPMSDCPDADLARQALAGARRVISIDTNLSASSQLADVVLAAAAHGEKQGTTTNIEGRVQTVSKRVTTRGTSRPDWMIAVELLGRFGLDDKVANFDRVDDITDAMAADPSGAFSGVTVAALSNSRDGVLAPAGSAVGELPLRGTASVDARNSYDYRLVVSRKLYDAGVVTSSAPSLSALAPGSTAHLHPLDFDRLGVARGADVRIIAARTTVVIPVAPDADVARGTVWVPFNQAGADIADAIDATAAVHDVRIEGI
ncbi:MAG: NADH-quinone oxidoreductase subunit NuoG [Actinomycetota bacterium]|nr:NADH-quinone oxidoreductase subunit NuoG [Actinomycetota bacterium]